MDAVFCLIHLILLAIMKLPGVFFFIVLNVNFCNEIDVDFHIT